MIYKTSLFSKALLFSALKRNWWVSALYAMFLFFLLPFYYLLQNDYLQNEWQRNSLQNSLRLTYNIGDTFQVLLICVVPVITAILLFRYMHKNNSAAMMHSLPFTRSNLYWSHNLAGFILLTLPVIFIGMILMVFQTATFLREYYSLYDIFQWMGYTLLFKFIFFSTAVFAGMFTGSSIAQGIFTYILHILPAGLYILITFNLERLLHGYSSSHMRLNYEYAIVNNLPLFALLNLGRPEFYSIFRIIVYIFITVLFFIGAYYVYKIRKIEAAGDVIAFTPMKPVFKYGVSICSMFLGGAYFADIAEGKLSIIIFGYLLSSLLGYFIAEILMQKSFRVWNSYKGYVVYAVILIIVLIGIQLDVTGYVNRIPEADEVQSVYFGPNISEWVQLKNPANGIPARTHIGQLFKTPENISNVIQLHSRLTQEPYNTTGVHQYIIYTLKNGRTLVRQYLVDEQQHASLLMPIYESLEYKQNRFPVLTQKIEEIKWVEIGDSRVPNRSIILTEVAEISEFIHLLQEELRHLTFHEMASQTKNFTNIRIINMNREEMHYSLRKNHVSIMNWLAAKDYYDKVFLQLEDIEYAVLEKTKHPEPSGYAPSQIEIRDIEIRDRDVIEELLKLTEAASYNHKQHSQEMIMVGFYIRTDRGHHFHQDFIYLDMQISNTLREYIKQIS